MRIFRLVVGSKAQFRELGFTIWMLSGNKFGVHVDRCSSTYDREMPNAVALGKYFPNNKPTLPKISNITWILFRRFPNGADDLRRVPKLIRLLFLLISLRWLIYIINPVDKTQLSSCILARSRTSGWPQNCPKRCNILATKQTKTA